MADLARGIDVSNYSGDFNWSATSGLSFGICRASQGLGAAGTNSPDPFLSWNWPRIKAKGLARGAYHFLDPRLDGAAQARYFVQTVSAAGLLNTDMLWLDNETAGASTASVAACARDFMATLTALRPHNPRGVYSYWDFIVSGNCAGLGGYPLWLAIFQTATPGAPSPWKAWKFWQSGTTNSYDNDVFNGSPADLNRWIASYQPEAEVQSGQLNTGANAVTVITVPFGSGSNIAFGCDNGIQSLPPASLRVAVFDTNWHITNDVTVDSTKGQTVIRFPNPGKTGVVSVRRQDAGEVIVGYEVSLRRHDPDRRGGLGERQDDGGRHARRAAELDLRRRGRLPSAGEHREDARRNPAHRRGPLAVAAGHRGLDRRARRGR
jgi:GH25 family lysozyme M1 (1,4-beta-N-acetylmuramidase)